MKKVRHNWTSETMGQCALRHLEQIMWVKDCYALKKERDKEIDRLLEHFRSIDLDIRLQKAKA